MRFLAILVFVALPVRACLAVPDSAVAQNVAPTQNAAQIIVVLVDGEPVTARDLVQRMLYRTLTGSLERANNFVARVNLVLTSDTAVQEKFKRRMDAAQPRTPAETQKATERIKKELIEDAMWKVLSEESAAKTAVIEAVVGDRLRLQAAKRFGIEITDEEVERSLIMDRLAAGEVYGGLPDMNVFYARKEEYGVSRKTVREIMRAELAWRAVLNRVCGPAAGWEDDGVYESLSRGYLGKLRQHALVEHRG